MLQCSYCDLSEDEVQCLITRDHVAICEQCVAECVEVLNAQIERPRVIFRADRERREAAALLEEAGDLAMQAGQLLAAAARPPAD